MSDEQARDRELFLEECRELIQFYSDHRDLKMDFSLETDRDGQPNLIFDLPYDLEDDGKETLATSTLRVAVSREGPRQRMATIKWFSSKLRTVTGATVWEAVSQVAPDCVAWLGQQSQLIESRVGLPSEAPKLKTPKPSRE